MKFYFIKFVYNNDTSKYFYKFGITHHRDALERFNSKYDARYDEFSKYCLFSVNGSEEDISELERKMTSMYPKNFNLESYLNTRTNYFNSFSGITETVRLQENEKNNILKYLNSLKGEYHMLKENWNV